MVMDITEIGAVTKYRWHFRSAALTKFRSTLTKLRSAATQALTVRAYCLVEGLSEQCNRLGNKKSSMWPDFSTLESVYGRYWQNLTGSFGSAAAAILKAVVV
jgi:hypothetical protein